MAKFIDHYYVATPKKQNAWSSLSTTQFDKLWEALNAYFALPKDKFKALGIHTDCGGIQGNMPSALDFLQCLNGIDTVIEDWKRQDLSWWQNPEIQAAVHEIKAARNIYMNRHENGVTKEQLEKHLLSGGHLDDLLPDCNGQECVIYKADRFYLGDTIVYIPDYDLNDIISFMSVDADAAKHILEHCYTGNDILQDCGGNIIVARHLFAYIDWQHPSSALVELQEDDEDAPPFYLEA